MFSISGEATWDKAGVNMNELEQDNLTNSTKIDLKDYHKHFDVVFIDSSGYLNICSKLDKTTFSKVKNEARLCISFMKSESFDCLEKLFIKNHSIEISCDSLINIFNLNNSSYSVIVEKTSTQLRLLEYYNNSYCVALESIKNVLYKAIEKRTSLIYLKSIDDVKVS